MQHLSTKNLQRYEFAPAKEGDPSPLIATYAVASMAQLAQIAHDVECTGAKRVPPATIRKHLREFLLTLEDDADRKRALHILDAQDRGVEPNPRPVVASGRKGRKRRAAAGAETEEGNAEALKDVELMVSVRRAAEFDSVPYREAVAAARFYQRITSMCVVRILLRDLEGADAEEIQFSAPHGTVDQCALQRIGFARLGILSDVILGAAQLTRAARKN